MPLPTMKRICTECDSDCMYSPCNNCVTDAFCMRAIAFRGVAGSTNMGWTVHEPITYGGLGQIESMAGQKRS